MADFPKTCQIIPAINFIGKVCILNYLLPYYNILPVLRTGVHLDRTNEKILQHKCLFYSFIESYLDFVEASD